MPGLLNWREAAAMLGVSPHTLRQWIHQRRVPFTRLGRAVRFDPRVLAAHIARHTITPEPAPRAPRPPVAVVK